MSETRDLVYRTNGEVRVLEELREWATFARQAGIVPRDLNAYQVMVVIQAGREVGIPPLHALRSISMIGGRVVMSVQLQLSLARARGVRVAKLVDGENYCEVTLTRDGETVTTKYTIEDARRAGLIRQGGNWEKYPRQMLRWRAIGDALRIIAPDAVAGLLSPEEAESIPPIDAEVVEVAAEPQPAPDQRHAAPRGEAQETQANEGEVDPELAEWRARVAQKWAELNPLPEGVSRQQQARLLRGRHQRLLEFAQSQYPEISDVKQLNVDQLQHIASLMEVDEFLAETS